MKSNSNKLQTKYIPVAKWKDFHPWPPVGGLRHLINKQKENGFHKVIKKIGRTILIDETAFFRWVEERNRK